MNLLQRLVRLQGLRKGLSAGLAEGIAISMELRYKQKNVFSTKSEQRKEERGQKDTWVRHGVKKAGL